MTKFNASIVTAVAALFVSGGAMAATLQPAAGNLPFVNQPAAVSTLTRSAVEAQAAADEPAAGQHSASDPAGASSTLARSAVEAQAAADQPAAGEQDPGYARASVAAPAAGWGWHFNAASSTPRMPAAGEFSSWAQPVSTGSALTRQGVEAQAAEHEPAAGDL